MLQITTALMRQGTDNLAHPPLNAHYRYLKVDIPGRSSALMVLGYVDPHPLGTIEVWYSAQGEVLRLQKGRIVGTAGLETDWRFVRFPQPPPAWTDQHPAFYTRIRDEMPGYRYGLTETIQVENVATPPNLSFPSSFPRNQAMRYRWIRESPSPTLPPSWFALSPTQGYPAYSYQCLSVQLCLGLQPWPIGKEPV